MSSEHLIREAQDPATSAARLAEIAQADRSTWPAIVFHPAAYDGLLQWLGERGDPTVNAALAARTSHLASLQAPAQAAAPVAPPVAQPVAQPPVEEPTAVIPAEPTPEPAPEAAPLFSAPEPTPEPTAYQPAAPEQTAYQPAAPEQTAVFPNQPAAYPTAYQASPGAPFSAAPTAAFGSVPPGGAEAQPGAADGNGGGNGKQLGFVIGMVVLIIALIGGAAFGATQVFGDDDDDSGITVSDTKKTEKPDASDDDTEAESATPEVPTAPAPDSAADSSAFCTSMKTVQDQSMDMLGDSGSTPDLDSMKAKAQAMADSYDDLEAAAPAEIKADVRVMSSYLDMLDDPTGDAAQDFDMTTYTEAAQRVGVYYAKNCL
jgi:hypothetical protein